VVRECVKALREESMMEKLTSPAAIQLKAVATGVRSMASRLEKKLIEVACVCVFVCAAFCEDWLGGRVG